MQDGHAYVHDGSVYFSIRSFPSYGELAQLDVSGLQTGASGVDTDKYDKEDARDFVLWKAWKPEDGDVFWKSDLGTGRPGWHMECSCMSIKYLGETIDIHAGAVDLIFPHHQNEIAQSEAVTGKRFVNYWLHGAHINVDDEKMSKSLGNFLTVRDIVSSPDDARAFRYLVVSNHYRTAFNFSKEVLDAARVPYEGWTTSGAGLARSRGQVVEKTPSLCLKRRVKDLSGTWMTISTRLAR